MPAERDLDRLLAEIPDPASAHAAAIDAGAAHGGALPSARSPSRAEVRLRRAVAIALSVAWVAVPLWQFGIRDDVGSLPPGFLALQLALFVGLATMLSWAALRPGRLGVGSGVALVAALAVAAPLAFLGVNLGWRPGGPIASTPHRDSVCLLATLFLVLGPVGLATLALRRAFPSAAVWRGAAIGAACGLVGAVTMNLHCAASSTTHVLVSHTAPIAIAALLGALAGRRFGRA